MFSNFEYIGSAIQTIINITMKKQIGLFLAGAALVSLASCGGGWDEESKKA